jgi:hypothetical protein
MAIGANSAIWFYGTADVITVGGGTSAVTDTSYSASGDVVSGGWQNDDDAPMASFLLKFQYPSGTIDVNGINLYVRLINSMATAAADEPQTDAGWPNHYLGTFVTDSGQAATTDTYYTLGPVGLPSTESGQEYEFYVYNDCGVTMTAGWTITITPMTYGPHA